MKRKDPYHMCGVIAQQNVVKFNNITLIIIKIIIVNMSIVQYPMQFNGTPINIEKTCRALISQAKCGSTNITRVNSLHTLLLPSKHD